MTASVSTNININDTASTQPSTNEQAGLINESLKLLQPVLPPSAAGRTVPSPPGVNKAPALSPRLPQTKEPSSLMQAMTGFRPTISALGASQSLNSTSTSPTTAATVTAVNGGVDTPKKIKKAVRAADPQSLKRSSGGTGSEDRTVRKKRAANPLAMLGPDGFSMSPISTSMVEGGSPRGSTKAAKGQGRGHLRLIPKPLTAMEATPSDGRNNQYRFQWPKTTDQHPVSEGARLYPLSSAPPMPLLPTEGLPGNLSDLIVFLDRFQLKWQDERLELVTYGLTDHDRIQLLLEVTTSPYGHVSTIRDYLQSRCEPRLINAGGALRPTLQNILDHLACAQKSRTSNAVRILLATTAWLMETITLELDQIPISGLYMINETYFRPDEDWPAVGQRIHPSIISLKYLAGLWEDVLRRSEDCSYILDLTLKEYERISEALAALREVWEVEGRVDLEEVGSMETRVDRVLRILGRKIRLIKAALRRPHVVSPEAFAATPVPVSTASIPHQVSANTDTRLSSTTFTPTIARVPTAVSAPETKSPPQMAGATISSVNSVQDTPTTLHIRNRNPSSPMDGLVLSTPQQPMKQAINDLNDIVAASSPSKRTSSANATVLSAPLREETSETPSAPQQPMRRIINDLNDIVVAASLSKRTSSANATILSAPLREETSETPSQARVPVPVSTSSPLSSAAPALASSSPIPTHSRAASLPQQVSSPSASTPAFSGAINSSPVTGRTAPTSSSRKVVPTLGSLSPVRSPSAPASSAAAIPVFPKLHGSTGTSNSSNARPASVTVYSMFPPYGLVNIRPKAPSASTETATKTTLSTESSSSSPSVSDITMTESQQDEQQHGEADIAMSILTTTTQLADKDSNELARPLTSTDVLPTIARRPSTPARIASTEAQGPHANEVIILDDDIAAPMTTPPMTKHMAEVDDHSGHQGDDEGEMEGEDGDDSTVELEDEPRLSVDSLTKDTASMKEPASLTGLAQPHEVKEPVESSASHTHERIISNGSSEAYHDAFQAFTGSEDEEDQLVDEDYDDYDTQPKGATQQQQGLRLSHQKAENYLGRAQSPLRHESQVGPPVVPSRPQPSAQSSVSTLGAATKQTKITVHMQQKIDAASVEAVKKAEAARRKSLIERPSWASADDDHDEEEDGDREVTPGLSSAATSTSTFTDRRSATPTSSSSSRLSMGRKESTTPTPKEKPAKPEKPEPAPLPIMEALTPEEEALAIARVQMTKDGKVYKMDVKRKGAVIIPAHLYVAPKTLLTPRLTPEELEALAAKSSLEGSGSRANSGGSGRRSTRRGGASEEPLLDLEVAQSIKRLRIKKETELRREREESALSSSSTTSKNTL